MSLPHYSYFMSTYKNGQDGTTPSSFFGIYSFVFNDDVTGFRGLGEHRLDLFPTEKSSLVTFAKPSDEDTYVFINAWKKGRMIPLITISIGYKPASVETSSISKIWREQMSLFDVIVVEFRRGYPWQDTPFPGDTDYIRARFERFKTGSY